MHSPSHRRFSAMAAMAAIAVVAGSLALTVPSAQAGPVFTNSETEIGAEGDVDSSDIVFGGTDCTFTLTDGEPTDVPLVENGPAASVATTVSGTYANAANVGDNGTSSGAASASGTVTSAAGTLRTMDFAAQSSAQLSNTLGTSPDCYRSLYASAALEVEFTVAQAGFLSLETENVGSSAGRVSLFRVTDGTDDMYVDSGGYGAKFNDTFKVYLAAGTYAGYFSGWSFVNDTSGSRSGTTTVHGEFAIAGSVTEVVQGKAKRFIKFPAARSCATDSVDASVTKSRARANQVQQVKFFVNDKLVKKAKSPKKGKTFSLAVADGVAADVRTEVKLFPARKGLPSKVKQATVTYEACS